MALTPADFRSAISGITATDDVIADALAEAQALHSATEFGTFLATAHLLTIDADSLPGEVTGLGIGAMSSASSPTARNARQAFFTATIYGRRLLARELSQGKAGVFAV